MTALLQVFVVACALSACSSAYSPATLPGAVSARQSNRDGSLQVLVPAGEFIMGSTDSALPADEKPAHTVYLNAFWIDRTEISNAHYAACVNAGVCAPIISPRPDMDVHPYYPVQGIAWPEAVAYCEWVGRRLPTEAEWEKAARGPGRATYPWGDQPPNQNLANFDAKVGDVVPVDSLQAGASPYAALNMAGNVWEWVADWYDESYYAQSPTENPTGPETGTLRGIRGGAWNTGPEAIPAANRFWAFPGRNDFDGFRCAANAE
ncbi:MAG: formylglycine-generating enzyme family protein [Chloroflexi bacterium]|nr:formylglycine-generating enzyme family protein [Chloroflexota bacterium]MQC26183.1 formylglycine-generating enzyme family protein [Chloroflexota bacterium]